MRKALVVACALLVSIGACLPAAHFADISDTLARRDLHCPNVIVGQYEDADWAFRAQGCGQIAYYRCSYAYKTMGRTQCCQRVASEGAASDMVALSGRDPYCEDHP